MNVQIGFPDFSPLMLNALRTFWIWGREHYGTVTYKDIVGDGGEGTVEGRRTKLTGTKTERTPTSC
jgi:hypothetical protein